MKIKKYQNYFQKSNIQMRVQRLSWAFAQWFDEFCQVSYRLFELENVLYGECLGLFFSIGLSSSAEMNFERKSFQLTSQTWISNSSKKTFFFCNIK